MSELTKLDDVIATKKCDNCVEIIIKDDVDLNDSTIRILGKDRNLLLQISNPKHKTEICLYTGSPMFVEVITHFGIVVKYVEGSGGEYYNQN
jgi:hypothetical protein